MFRLERHTDDAEMTAQLCTYFVELGVPNVDPAEITAEFLYDPNLRVFRILDDAPLGFLVTEDYPEFTEMSEFCVFPDHRRRGIGTRAAHLAFAGAPGAWELGTMNDAIHFWRHVLKTYPFARDGVEGPSALAHQTHRLRFTIGTDL
jgi:predicted acetyltransferase